MIAAAAGATLLAVALGWNHLSGTGDGDEPAMAAATPEPSARPPQRRVSSVAAPAAPLATSAQPVAATGRAAAGQPRRAAERTSLPADPRERCGDRRFFALLACVKRECERPEVAAHPECRRLTDLESPPAQP
jgi:hypothetical protein